MPPIILAIYRSLLAAAGTLLCGRDAILQRNTFHDELIDHLAGCQDITKTLKHRGKSDIVILTEAGGTGRRR